MNTATPLTPQEIQLVKSSFASLLGKFTSGTDLTMAIYDRLFEVAPEARAMFSPSQRTQAEKLKAMLVQLVAYLDKPDKLNELTTRLGQSHSEYQVESAHYDILKEVLVHVFQDKAADVFDAPTLEVWGKTYDFIAAQMLSHKV